MKPNSKVLLVCSSGGHLLQLFRLAESLPNCNGAVWVTFNKSDSRSILKDKRVYWGYFPTNRNFVNLFKNSILAVRIFWLEKPTTIISTGAGMAIPFFVLARLLGKNSIYLESFARMENLSLTGKLLYPLAKHFYVQSEELSLRYKKAKFMGSIY